MQAVGIRELKNKLSHYVRLVSAGESVLVTDRGTVVAELRPPGVLLERPYRDSISDRLDDLARRGAAVLGAEHDPELYAARPSVLPDGAAADLLEAERSSR